MHSKSQPVNEVMESFREIARQANVSVACLVMCEGCQKEDYHFLFHLPASWNGCVEDGDPPYGWGIVCESDAVGVARAKELFQGSARIFWAMDHFGERLQDWGMRMLKALAESTRHAHVKGKE